MREAIYNHLTGDTAFMDILTGGFYDASVVGEISRQNTPNAYDTHREIKPCGILRLGGPVPIPPYMHGARLTFSLFFYELFGYANIEAARERAYTLLHNQKLTPVGATTAGCWDIRHVQDILHQEDEALKASMEVSRFEGVIRRR